MALHFKVRIAVKMRDIGLAARIKIIYAEEIVARSDQSVTEVRPEKTGSAGNQNFTHSLALYQVEGKPDPSKFATWPTWSRARAKSRACEET
jgi:hypothetical protein